jgi:hypothetical protein
MPEGRLDFGSFIGKELRALGLAVSVPLWTLDAR